MEKSTPFFVTKKDTDKAKGSGTKGVYIPTKSMSKHSIQYLLENVNKKDEIVKEGNTKNGVTQTSPSSVISVSDLFALVNKKKKPRTGIGWGPIPRTDTSRDGFAADVPGRRTFPEKGSGGSTDGKSSTTNYSVSDLFALVK